MEQNSTWTLFQNTTESFSNTAQELVKMNTCKEQEQLAYNTERRYTQCSSICLVFLSSSLHRRTSSCLIIGNRFCTS